MRVLGFWNKTTKSYHWYVTNLSIPADLIYKLYRIRWQVELSFKAAKSSLSLADTWSSNRQLVLNILLAAITSYCPTTRIGLLKQRYTGSPGGFLYSAGSQNICSGSYRAAAAGF